MVTAEVDYDRITIKYDVVVRDGNRHDFLDCHIIRCVIVRSVF